MTRPPIPLTPLTPLLRGRRVLAALAVLAMALMSLFVPAGHARAASSSVQVSLGYADDLRANPTRFPTPWAGSPGVIFQGCASCSLDSGAIRIVNNTPLAVTVDSVVVKFGTCAFDIWPHNTAVPVGDQLIDAQTGADFEAGCATDGSFDTSDIGPNGENWASNCNQSGVHPEVDVTVDGVLNTFTDSGQVLNTGGVDKAGCDAADPNESTQWTPVGSAPCPGATLTLTPPSQTDTVGATAVTTATLADTCGVGLQGALVHFAVGSGPDAGAAGAIATDPNGQATFAYPGAAVGTDSVVATVSNPAGTISSNTVAVVWMKRAATLTVAAGTSDFDDAVTVSGTLADALGPIPGQPVTFSLNGTESCTATTGADGTAACSVTPQEPAGPYTLTATAPATAVDFAASGSAAFAVTLEETTLVYTGPNRAANAQPYAFSGVLTEDGTTPIAGRTVAFSMGSGAAIQGCTGTTDAAGHVSCSVTVNQPAALTAVPVSGTFGGDAYYVPATVAAVTVPLNYLTGEAYGLATGGLVGIAKTPHAGPVSTSVASTSGPVCVASMSGLISADTLCASVVTTLAPGTSTAKASVQDASVGVLGLPAIKIGAVTSVSTSTCTGSTGDASVASISVGGIPLNVSLHPAPNTTISVLGVTIVLNEQVPEAGADHGLTVNAVHIKAAGLLDVVLASATSDIHNC